MSADKIHDGRGRFRFWSIPLFCSLVRAVTRTILRARALFRPGVYCSIKTVDRLLCQCNWHESAVSRIISSLTFSRAFARERRALSRTTPRDQSVGFTPSLTPRSRASDSSAQLHCPRRSDSLIATKLRTNTFDRFDRSIRYC